VKTTLRTSIPLALMALLATSTIAAAIGGPAEPETGSVVDCMRASSTTPCIKDTEGQPAKAPVQAPAQASVLDAVASAIGAIGSAIADGGAAVAGAVAAAGGAIMGLLAAYAGLLASLRPATMDPTLYAAGAAVATGAVTAAAQTSLWALARRYAGALSLLLPLFSRIEKDELLENERRAQIFELIKQQPGIHLSQIARSLDLAWGTTLHHLRKLREQRLVQIKQNGHHKCFFINGSGYSDQQMQAMSLLKNDTLADVASAIEAHAGSSLKQVSEALGISSPLAAFHVRKLERAGLIRKERAGKQVRLTPSGLLPVGFFNEMRPHACAAEGAVGYA
jgi:Mn-dependent DtxR family transcriptional regulator